MTAPRLGAALSGLVRLQSVLRVGTNREVGFGRVLRYTRRMPRPSLVAALGLAGIVAACGSRRAELDWPATEPGNYRVGFKERTVSYTPVGFDQPRALRTLVWYPTRATEGRPVAYMGGDPRPDVFASAPVIEAGDLPVMVYSHGSRGFPEAAYFMCEYFATHGFVVVAPAHTGNTLVNLADDVTTEMYLHRPEDITATLDWLYDLPSNDSLSGRLSDEVVLSGHSFGGYTAFAVGGARYAPVSECEPPPVHGNWCGNMTDAYASRFSAGFADPRVDVLFPHAPGAAKILGPGGVSAVSVPVLLMTGARDQQTPNDSQGDPYWASLEGSAHRRVDLPNAGHHSFTVTCELLPAIGTDDGCGDDFLDFREVWRLMNVFSLAFARRHLFDDDGVDPILEGAESLGEGYELVAK